MIFVEKSMARVRKSHKSTFGRFLARIANVQPFGKDNVRMYKLMEATPPYHPIKGVTFFQYY